MPRWTRLFLSPLENMKEVGEIERTSSTFWPRIFCIGLMCLYACAWYKTLVVGIQLIDLPFLISIGVPDVMEDRDTATKMGAQKN